MRRPTFREKGYTAQWDKYSKQYRQRNPLCVKCKEQGKVTPAQCVDHIKPVVNGQEDPLFWEPSNHQSLCKTCHSYKTVTEDGGFGQTHPYWIPKPACPVTIVCGPPAAGKNTYIEQHARKADTIIDLDECFRIACGKHGHEAGREHLSAALRVRNRMLADLTSTTRGKAWVIVSAPTKAEREWWADLLHGEVVLIDTDKDICLSRIDGPRAEIRRAAVNKWFKANQIGEWKPRGRQYDKTVGIDGWPTDPRHPANKRR